MSFDMIGAGLKGAGMVMDQINYNKSRAAARDMATQNIEWQQAFAKNALQWKVKDAEKAGVHPLYALGAPTMSFSPVSLGGGSAPSMAASLGSMGQDISRALAAGMPKEGKIEAFTQAAQTLQLENMQLQNDKLRSDIAKTNNAGTPSLPPSSGGDAYLIPGQAESGLVKTKPLEIAPPHSSNPSHEPASITDTGFARTATGLVPIPSKDVKERIEDIMPHEWAHYIRNNIGPYLGAGKPPAAALPAWADAWRWHPSGEWRPARKNFIWKDWEPRSSAW